MALGQAQECGCDRCTGPNPTPIPRHCAPDQLQCLAEGKHVFYGLCPPCFSAFWGVEVPPDMPLTQWWRRYPNGMVISTVKETNQWWPK